MKLFIKGLVIAIVIMMLMTAASAYTWYTDHEEVFFYNGSPVVKMSDVQLNQGVYNRSYMESRLLECVQDWNSTTNPVPCTFTSGSGVNGSQIAIRMGTPSYLWNTHQYAAVNNPTGSPSVLNGSSFPGSRTRVVTPDPVINGQSRIIRVFTGDPNRTIAYVVNKHTSGTFTPSGYSPSISVSYSSRSETGHKNTLKHELGHALGHRGHVTGSTNLMYSSTSNTTAMNVSATNRTQITQFRSVYGRSLPAGFSAETGIIYNFNLRDDYFASAYKEQAIGYILEWYGFHSNIFFGIPEAVVYGETHGIVSDSGCESEGIVEYKFRITNNLSGNISTEYVYIRSQIGDIFETGKEYCISPVHLNNTLWDTHIIYSMQQIIETAKLNEEDIILLNEKVSSTVLNINAVPDEARPEPDFLSNVKLAVEIIPTRKEQYAEDGHTANVFDIEYKLNKVLCGEEYIEILPELLRINSDVDTGVIYIILLDVIDDEFVLPVSRSGAVISEHADTYLSYKNAYGDYDIFTPSPEDTLVVSKVQHNITSRQLADMITSGEIPQSTKGLLLGANKIDDITPLTMLPDLESAALEYNDISSLEPLREMKNLVFLALEGNNIRDLTPLYNLTKLERVDLGDNPISETELAALKKALPDCHITFINFGDIDNTDNDSNNGNKTGTGESKPINAVNMLLIGTIPSVILSAAAVFTACKIRKQ